MNIIQYKKRNEFLSYEKTWRKQMHITKWKK